MFRQITWWSLHHHGTAALWYSSYLKLLKIELKLIVESRRFKLSIQDIDISTRAKTFACIAIICWCDWCQDQASGQKAGVRQTQPTPRTLNTFNPWSGWTINKKNWLPKQLQPLTINQKSTSTFKYALSGMDNNISFHRSKHPEKRPSNGNCWGDGLIRFSGWEWRSNF